MKRIFGVLAVSILPLALLAEGEAGAAPPAPKGGAAKLAAGGVAKKGGAAKGKRRVFGFMRVLIKKGALRGADLTALRAHKRKLGACWRAARAGQRDGKAECRPLRAEFVKAQRATYERALPNVKSAKLKAKTQRFISWLSKTEARLRGKLPAKTK